MGWRRVNKDWHMLCQRTTRAAVVSLQTDNVEDTKESKNQKSVKASQSDARLRFTELLIRIYVFGNAVPDSRYSTGCTTANTSNDF